MTKQEFLELRTSVQHAKLKAMLRKIENDGAFKFDGQQFTKGWKLLNYVGDEIARRNFKDLLGRYTHPVPVPLNRNPNF